jgi:hypothetical protein
MVCFKQINIKRLKQETQHVYSKIPGGIDSVIFNAFLFCFLVKKVFLVCIHFGKKYFIFSYQKTGMLSMQALLIANHTVIVPRIHSQSQPCKQNGPNQREDEHTTHRQENCLYREHLNIALIGSW